MSGIITNTLRLMKESEDLGLQLVMGSTVRAVLSWSVGMLNSILSESNQSPTSLQRDTARLSLVIPVTSLRQTYWVQ